MYNFLKTLYELIYELNNTPKREKEISVMIKDILNSGFDNKIICKNIFISKGNDTISSPANVIPIMPTSDIMEVDTIKYYDIEINTDVITGNDMYTPIETVAWILHELAENVMTDKTLIRFKKNLIKYYDLSESGIKSVLRTVGYIVWIGVFSRTHKELITYTSSDFFANYLRTNELDDYIDAWNRALKKYVSANGGDNKILTDNYLELKDKSEFLTFNRLAREYSAYAVKYNDTTYPTFAKYLIASEKSELIKHYIEREPKHLAIFKEKEIFNIFNDNKILYESAESDLIKEPNTRSFIKDFSELELDVNNVISTSDKIRVAVKLKDFQLDITKALETDTLNNDVLQDLREKTFKLISKLDKIEVVPAVMEELQ